MNTAQEELSVVTDITEELKENKDFNSEDLDMAIIDIYKLASDLVVDDLIAPCNLRNELIARYETFANKEYLLPAKKHGTILS